MTVIAMNHSNAKVAGDESKTWAEDAGSEPTPMSAEAFLGQWKDSIGHDVCVAISEGLLVATLTKPEGGKPKELCIHMDHSFNWRCGNGVLHDYQGLVYRKDSKHGQPLALSWVTWNGKKSTWTRCADRSPKPCRDAEAWWKMTEEWEEERGAELPVKDTEAWWKSSNGKEAEAKSQQPTRASRRSRAGRAHQKWVECRA